MKYKQCRTKSNGM